MFLKEDSCTDEAPVDLYSVDADVGAWVRGRSIFASSGYCQAFLKMLLSIYTPTCRHLNSPHPSLHLV